MPRRDDDEYDDDEEYDDQPRRRRRTRVQPDPTGGLIPLRNGPALAAYYCGVFGCIPFLGMPLTVAALVLGILGRAKAKREPGVGGVAHAWAGIVLGTLQLLGYFALVALTVVFAAAS